MRNSVAAVLLGSVALAVFAAPASAAGPNYTYTTVLVSQPGSGPLGTIWGFGAPSLNDKGAIAFTGQDLCASGVCFSVFTRDPSGTVTRIIEGGPPGAPDHLEFQDAIVNARGDVSFSVQEMNGYTQTATWLDLWKNASVTQVTPTVATGYIPYTVRPAILSNGNVLYGDSATRTLALARPKKAPLPVAPGYCTQMDGPAGGSPTGLAGYLGSALNGWVAFSGGANDCAAGHPVDGIVVSKAPNGPTSLRIASDTYSLGSFGAVTINQGQTVAFSTRYIQSLPTHVDGLFLQKLGAPVQKIAEIDNGACADAPPASGSCLYQAYSQLAINAKATIVTNIRISTWTAGKPQPSSTFGVALNGDLQNGQLAFPGMVINGCTVQSAGASPRSIDKDGNIAILLNCAPTTPGAPPLAQLVIASPPSKKH